MLEEGMKSSKWMGCPLTLCLSGLVVSKIRSEKRNQKHIRKI